MSEILWCCHVRGPDDVYAAPNYETALAWADYVNSLNWHDPKRLPKTASDCLLRATPAPWLFGAEKHAENLPIDTANMTPRSWATYRAGPDLLRELKALLPRFESACRHAGNGDDVIAEATAAARAAIALAEGCAP